MQHRVIDFDSHVTSHLNPPCEGGYNITLNLSKMGLHDCDVPLIHEYLLLHPEINELILFCNYLTDHGAIAISHIKTLNKLYIAMNAEVSAKGLIALIYDSNLKWLDAGHTALNELPAERWHGGHQLFAEYVNKMEVGLPLPLLSLAQLSIFAIKGNISLTRRISEKTLEERTPAETIYSQLHDETLNPNRRTPHLTQVPEYSFSDTLDIYKRERSQSIDMSNSCNRI